MLKSSRQKIRSPVAFARDQDSTVTQERSLQTREAILRAAVEEFAERGLAGARVERIAEKAGANKQGLYYHFGSKSALFRAALLEALESLIPDYRGALKGKTDCEQKMSALVGAVFDQISRSRKMLRIIAFENLQRGIHLDDEARRRLVDARREFINVLYRTIEEGQESGRFRPDIDPTWVIGQVFAMSEFNFSNAYTIAVATGRDPTSADAIVSWRSHVIQVTVATLKPAAPGQKSSR